VRIVERNSYSPLNRKLNRSVNPISIEVLNKNASRNAAALRFVNVAAAFGAPANRPVNSERNPL
jgi:hypothetical protein